jgi:hypothetical protein
MPRTEVGALTFTLWVEWPEADVDLAFSEVVGTMCQPSREVKDNKTPTMGSVDRFLSALMRDSVLEAAGVTVRQTHGLMMGTCSATFEVDYDKYEKLPELVDLAKRRMNLHRTRRVRFHRRGNVLRGSCVVEVPRV